MSSKSARRRERLEQALPQPGWAEPAAEVAARICRAEVMAAPEPPPVTPTPPQTFPTAFRIIYEYTHDARRD